MAFKFSVGDIVLTAPRKAGPLKFVTDIISKWTKGRWSHVAMYAGDWRGKHMLIESNFDGVRYIPLDMYGEYDICVVRSDLDVGTLEKVIVAASGDLGKGYDYKGLFGFAMSDIVYKITKHRKAYQTADRLFCSELVKHHYEHAGELDLTGKPSCNTSPMDLYRSKHVKKVYEGQVL